MVKCPDRKGETRRLGEWATCKRKLRSLGSCVQGKVSRQQTREQQVARPAKVLDLALQHGFNP